MKIYLDDLRETPDGWYRCYWPQEVINLLQTETVEIVSLDHDLGHDTITGNDVVKWIEEAVFTKGYIPPKIVIHSANPVGKARMQAGINQIENFFSRESN